MVRTSNFKRNLDSEINKGETTSVQEINLSTWEHQHSFNFFQTFDCPLVNITLPIDLSKIYHWAKKTENSFFLISLFAILKALNQTPQMRQRILTENKIVEFNKIAVVTPLFVAGDETLMVLLEYHQNFNQFKKVPEQIIQNVKNGVLNEMNYDMNRQDIVCVSCMPFLDFTSLTCAKMDFKMKTYPVLSWGKMDKKGKTFLSIQFDHRFIDGVHLSHFQQFLNHFLENPKQL